MVNGIIEEDSIFNRLLKRLDKLVDKQFQNSIRAFIPDPAIQAVLPSSIQTISRGDFLGFLQPRDDLEKYEDFLNKNYPIDPPPPVPASPHIYFTNRKDEIDKLTSSLSSTSPYFLVYAPAGYGKTEVLVEIDNRLAEKNWKHVLIAVDGNTTCESMARKIAKALNIQLPAKTENGWGCDVGSAFIEQYSRSQFPNLVLLIDLAHDYSKEVLNNLLDIFIPDLWGCLGLRRAYKDNRSLFRIIVAGRNPGIIEQTKKSRLPLDKTALSAFTYEVICDTARKYLQDFNEEDICDISAHILYLTGGHPGCIAAALNRYLRSGVRADKFLEELGKKVWDDIVRPVAGHVFSLIPNYKGDFGKVTNQLSLFRYSDDFIARNVLADTPLENMHITDEYDLSDKLTMSYIFIKDGPYLKDDIMRRLLVIRLRNEDPTHYLEYSQQAQAFCLDHLKEEEIREPERWVIEYLFLTLEKFIIDGEFTRTIRNKIKNELEANLVKGMELYLDRRNIIKKKQRKAEIDILLNKMDAPEHWEFRFAVNYHLRNGKYRDEPYQTLRNRIEKFNI